MSVVTSIFAGYPSVLKVISIFDDRQVSWKMK